MAGKLSLYRPSGSGGSGQAVDVNALSGGSPSSSSTQRYAIRKATPSGSNTSSIASAPTRYPVGEAPSSSGFMTMGQPDTAKGGYNSALSNVRNQLSGSGGMGNVVGTKLPNVPGQGSPGQSAFPTTRNATNSQQGGEVQYPGGAQLDLARQNMPIWKASTVPGVSDVAQTQAQQYQAQSAGLSPDQTSVGIMSKMLGEDSPYMQAARLSGSQGAASRGLHQSSLAVEAAEKAAIEGAQPFALQDAQSQTQVALANQEAINRSRAQGAELGTQVNLANIDAQNQMIAAQAEMAISEQLANQQSILSMGEAAAAQALNERSMHVDEAIRTRLAGVEQTFAMQLETLRQEYEIDKNLTTQAAAVYDGALRSISNVLENENLTTEQSTNAVQVILDNMRSGLAFLNGVSASAGGGAGAAAVTALGGGIPGASYYPGEKPVAYAPGQSPEEKAAAAKKEAAAKQRQVAMAAPKPGGSPSQKKEFDKRNKALPEKDQIRMSAKGPGGSLIPVDRNGNPIQTGMFSPEYQAMMRERGYG